MQLYFTRGLREFLGHLSIDRRSFAWEVYVDGNDGGAALCFFKRFFLCQAIYQHGVRVSRDPMGLVLVLH